MEDAMPLTNASGAPLTQTQLTALGTAQAADTVYKLDADVYEKFFMPGEDPAGGPSGWRRRFRAGELLTASQISGLYPAPVVNSVTPASGSHLGGTTVKILGSNLSYGGSAQFGGSYATSVVVNEHGTELTCVTPAHAVGAVTVAVNDGSNTGTLAAGYTYT
jgi:hypothetical protein